MIIAYVLDIQYRAGDLALVSTLSRLADKAGEASEQGGMEWARVNTFSEGIDCKTPTRGRRVGGSVLNTEKIHEMIDKTVSTAIARVRAEKPDHGSAASSQDLAALRVCDESTKVFGKEFKRNCAGADLRAECEGHRNP